MCEHTPVEAGLALITKHTELGNWKGEHHEQNRKRERQQRRLRVPHLPALLAGLA